MIKMRTEEEMYALILDFARSSGHVRAVILEGSRANIHIPADEFQDYDITFLVDDIKFFTENEEWLDGFGKRIMMQKPEAMELYEPEIIGFSYLMLFEDYNKMDLTLVPVSERKEYLNSDKLMKVLLDKEGLIPGGLIPSDEDYHIKMPTAGMFDDCCSEFWNVTPYVVKGLCRGEFLFAADHLNEILRKELLRMLGWEIGTKHGFEFSLGKNYKFIRRYLPVDTYGELEKTFRMDGCEAVWNAMFRCHEMFRKSAKAVGEHLGYRYPEYDSNISRYCMDLYEKFRGKEILQDITARR